VKKLLGGLFDGKPRTTAQWEKLADRRSSSATVRLAAGLFLLYQRATNAKETDPFVRDEKTWGLFEQAALPEMASFSYFDRKRDAYLTPSAVLSDSMYHIWTLDKLPGVTGRPTTIQVIGALAQHICAAYETTPIDRRTRKRASLGLDVTG